MSGFFSGKDKERDQHKPEHEPGKPRPGEPRPGQKPGDKPEREPGKQPEKQPEQEPAEEPSEPPQPGQKPPPPPTKPGQQLGQPPGRREDEQQEQEDQATKKLKRQSEGFEEKLKRGERTTTTPDSVTGEEAETKPVGEFDQMSSTERLEFLRGWGQKNRLGGPMSAAWEEFDAAVGEPPEQSEAKLRSEGRVKQGEKAKKSGESHLPFESETRLA